MSGALATYAMLIALVPVIVGAAVRTIPAPAARPESERETQFGGPPSLALPLGMAGAFAVLPLAAWGVGKPREVVFALLRFSY